MTVEIRSPLQMYVASKSRSQIWSNTPVQAGVCPVSVDRGDSRWSNIQQCGKSLKAERPVREGHSNDEVKRPVCGLHASVYDRALKKAEEAAASKVAANSALSQATKDAERISKALGVEVEADARMNRTFVYVPTGYVRIKISDLLVALDLPAE